MKTDTEARTGSATADVGIQAASDFFWTAPMRQGSQVTTYWLALLSCAGVLPPLTAAIAAPQFIRVAADVQLLTYSNSFAANPGIESTRTFSLTCIVGTNEWRIDDDNFVPNRKEAWYFDGTNVYESVQLMDGWFSHKSAGGFPLSSNAIASIKSNVTVFIRRSQGPPLGHLGVNIGWLAFCSGPYLKKPGRDIPMPATEVSVDPFSLAYSDTVETFDDSLALPKTLKLHVSLERYQKSKTDPRLFRYSDVFAQQPPLDLPDKAMAFTYLVDTFTNAFGWTFPLSFEYTRYRFDTNGNPSPFVGGKGRVSSIIRADRPEHVFFADSAQTIVDYRFRHNSKRVDGIVYSATNLNSAPDTNSPALQARFAALVKQASGTAQRHSVPFLLIILLFSTPVLLLFRRKLTKQGKRS